LKLTAAEILQFLEQSDEHSSLEVKTGQKVDKSILETVCAFANEPGMGGGLLLLGVESAEGEERRYRPVGLQDPDTVQTDLATQARSSFNHPVRIELSTEIVEGKTLVLAEVKEAPTHHKPIYIASQGLPKGAYRRVGSLDQRLTHEELQEFFASQDGETFDQTTIKGTESDDLDPRLVRRYRQLSQTGVDFDDDDLLYSLHAVDSRKDPGCTLAGLILFGKSLSLRRYLPMTRVDYITVNSLEWVPDPDNRFETLEFRDGLISLIPRLVNRIIEDIPKKFFIPEGEIARKDLPVIPRVVIREAVVNALMHRCFRTRQPVQIIRYPNRLEIRNPGYSLVSEEQFGNPGSVTRNEKIAAVLHEIGYAETKGSGIRVMREAMKQANLSYPVFHSDRENNRFTLILLSHHFLSEEDTRWLSKFKKLNLNEAEARVLIATREIGAMNNSVVRALCGLDTLAASSLLGRLRNAGLLEKKGAGPATYYVPTFPAQTAAPLSFPGLEEDSLVDCDSYRSSDGSFRHNDDSYRNKDGSLRNSDESYRNKDGSLRNSDESYRNRNALPKDLQARLDSLGKRANPQTVERLIVALCSHREFTKAELAKLLSRTERTLESYLSRLTRTQQIELTKPLSATHPNQSYRAKEQRNSLE
jgi:ATP-dependent DNA helicase RecG